MTIVKKYEIVLYAQIINAFLILLLTICNKNDSVVLLLMVLALTEGGLHFLQAKFFRLQIIKEFFSVEAFKKYCNCNDVVTLPDNEYFRISGYTLFEWGIFLSKLKLSNEMEYMKKYFFVPVILSPLEFVIIFLKIICVNF